MKSAALPSPHEPVVVGRLLLFADRLVAEYLSKEIGEELIPPYTAIGIVSADGRIVGGVIFNQLHEGNVEVSLVAPRRVSRGMLRASASYAFETLACSRVTARTRASNLHARRFIERVGFQQEGVLRSYYADGDDAILYGLLKGECRW